MSGSPFPSEAGLTASRPAARVLTGALALLAVALAPTALADPAVNVWYGTPGYGHVRQFDHGYGHTRHRFGSLGGSFGNTVSGFGTVAPRCDTPRFQGQGYGPSVVIVQPRGVSRSPVKGAWGQQRRNSIIIRIDD